jgi:hypothetical protein
MSAAVPMTMLHPAGIKRGMGGVVAKRVVGASASSRAFFQIQNLNQRKTNRANFTAKMINMPVTKM